jgi:hypothetical protein
MVAVGRHGVYEHADIGVRGSKHNIEYFLVRAREWAKGLEVDWRRELYK